MPEIVSVGISYRTAPVEVRERFSFSDTHLGKALRALRMRENVLECCIVSTCNRVEVYAVAENSEECGEEIKSFLLDFHKLPSQNLYPYMHTLLGSDAAKHLFRVAASIDSMVIGETQILNQLENSYCVAHLEGTTGLILNRLFNRAFFAGKKVRSETGISSQAVSISYLGVELAKRIFDNLANRSAMLVGTGEMGELFAKHLVSNNIKELYVTNRNFRHAEDFSQSLGGEPIRFEEMLYRLKDVDIVVTATGSSDYIIKREHVKQSLKLRKNEPIFMIDIAVPRDIDPNINRIPGVYLYDIDDLQVVQGENLNSRKENLKKAEEIILSVERGFADWMESLKVFPVIIDIKKKFEGIKKSELKRALQKLEGGVAAKDVVESMANSIIGKIFHDPVTNLKKRASGYESALYSEVTRNLFELDPENSSSGVTYIYDEAENWDQR